MFQPVFRRVFHGAHPTTGPAHAPATATGDRSPYPLPTGDRHQSELVPDQPRGAIRISTSSTA